MNRSDLVAFCPQAANFKSGLDAAADRYGIITNLRIAHWMTQLAHESAGFTAMEENLNYSAQGLRATFGKYFTGPEAIAYQRKPQQIANRVYANRNGNGDEASGDGWKYRARSPIGLTFAANYAAAGKALGLPLLEHPELAADPDHAGLVAGWFWDTRKLNVLADADDLVGIRTRVNGGLNGLQDCVQLLKKARAIWP